MIHSRLYELQNNLNINIGTLILESETCTLNGRGIILHKALNTKYLKPQRFLETNPKGIINISIPPKRK